MEHSFCPKKFWGVVIVFEHEPSPIYFATLFAMAVVGELTGFEAFLNEKPTLDELCRHVRVETKWYAFGVLLKLDIIKLDCIRLMNEDGVFKAIKMFELWLSSNPTATRREIIETLRTETISEKTIAEDYNKALKESKTYCNCIY